MKKRLLYILSFIVVFFNSCSDIINSDSNIKIEKINKNGAIDSLLIKYSVGNEFVYRDFGVELDYGQLMQGQGDSKFLIFKNNAEDEFTIYDAYLKKNTDFKLSYYVKKLPVTLIPNELDFDFQINISFSAKNKEKGFYYDTLVLNKYFKMTIPVKIEVI